MLQSIMRSACYSTVNRFGPQFLWGGALVLALALLYFLLLTTPVHEAWAQDSGARSGETVMVSLDQESVASLSQELLRLVDERAAELAKGTERDLWADSKYHFYIISINTLSAFINACAVFAGFLLIAWMGGMRSLREVRDAVDEWRKTAKEHPQLAGMMLLSGAIVAGFTIFGFYFFMASVATPHG